MNSSLPLSQFNALQRIFFLAILGLFAIFFLPGILDSADLVQGLPIRVIYGGNLLGTLEPCG